MESFSEASEKVLQDLISEHCYHEGSLYRKIDKLHDANSLRAFSAVLKGFSCRGRGPLELPLRNCKCYANVELAPVKHSFFSIFYHTKWRIEPWILVHWMEKSFFLRLISFEKDENKGSEHFYTQPPLTVPLRFKKLFKHLGRL